MDIEVSFLSRRRFIEALPNMGFAPCYVVSTRGVIRLSHKLQISRLARPFKVSCLRADYTPVNFNNESHTHHTHANFRWGTVRRRGERRKQTPHALLARFEVIAGNGTKLTVERLQCMLHCQQLNIFSRRAFSLRVPAARQRRHRSLVNDERSLYYASWSPSRYRTSVVKSQLDKPRSLDLQKRGSLKRFTNN